ncbi:MAG: PIF1 family DEAD/DEAH box helicase [Bifidobacteriaceae bacterium]|nr:PIF1 family DEAD/DEAH box helicase [Bifidobacteriaceae bacterium]
MKQDEALQIMNAGASVFLTGAPGAGKTYVLNKFVEHARATGRTVSVTATTGIAATHINGQTIHSWSGIGVAQAPSEALIRRIRSFRRKALQSADALVIDEVSMMPAWQFDLVDQVCRAVRRSHDEPFGGLQVIVSGDLFQLPPVVSSQRNRFVMEHDDEVMEFRKGYSDAGLDPDGFITQSFAWRDLGAAVCYLTEQHRQDVGDLLRVLTHIREGRVTPEDNDALLARVRSAPANSSAVRLYPTNRQADQLNDMRLHQLTGMPRVYTATATGSPTIVQHLKRSMLAPEQLVLKEGAAVMALRNDTEHRYVNGSLGVVIGFGSRLKNRETQPDAGAPVVRFENGNTVTMQPADWEVTDNDAVLASVSQIPLRCAWGITIHKSQGMTLDAAVMDLRRAFAPGMGYVALSRVESMGGLYLEGMSPRAYDVSDEAMHIDAELARRSAEALETLHGVGAIALTRPAKPAQAAGGKAGKGNGNGTGNAAIGGSAGTGAADDEDESSQGTLF